MASNKNKTEGVKKLEKAKEQELDFEKELKDIIEQNQNRTEAYKKIIKGIQTQKLYMKNYTLYLALFLFTSIQAFGQSDASIHVTDGASSIQNVDVTLNGFILQTNASGDVTFTNLPDNTYPYIASIDCYEMANNSITIAGINAFDTITLSLLDTANVFWNVNETSSPMSFPVASADISMTDGTNTYTLAYNPGGFIDNMMNVAFGTYTYTISTDCHEDVTGTVTVDCANLDPFNPTPTVAVWEVQGAMLDTANVFWNVNETSSPMSFPVASADISMTDGTNTYTLAYNPGGFIDNMMNVAFGTYTYTISTDCHEDVTGTVTVDCANLDPFNPTPTVAVWEVQGAMLDTANVFWNVNETSSPMSFPVASADISMTDGTNTYTLAYNPGGFIDNMMNVAFGTYTYTISTDCHEDVTGTVTVDCANLDPFNPTPTVAVWEVQGAMLDTANVFWNVNETSSPMSFPVASADISMTDGTNTYTLAYNPGGFIDNMMNVAFGTYTYTISTDCHEDVTGTVTVDCANLDPFNPTPTVAVWEVQGAMLDTANVFWNVNETSSPMSFPVASADISMTDGTNTYTLAYNPGGFIDNMMNVAFGTYTYTISTDCHEDVTGTVTVDCANLDPFNPTPTVAVWEVQGAMLDTANVFWNVNETSSPMSFPVASADISMTDGTNTYTLAYNPGGFIDNMMNVAFGTYTYTISTDCHEDVTGTVTVDCANLDPFNPTPTVAVWEVQGAMLDTANVFWNVNETSSPMSFPVASADISMTDGTNTYTLAYDPGSFTDNMFNVAFGTYTYTISTDCHSDVTGSVTVGCATLDANNPTPTVAVWEVQGAALSTKDVVFNIGTPTALIGANVTLTDGGGYNESFVTSLPNGSEVISDVPFGSYTYTISKDCHVSISGTLIVDCDSSSSIVINENPVEIIIDNTVSQTGNVLTAIEAGMTYQWVDCGNNNEAIIGETGQSYTPIITGNYAVVITNGTCSVTSDCIEVIITNIRTIEQSLHVSCFPNPVQGILNIEMDEVLKNGNIQIVNMQGQVVVKDKAPSSNNFIVNVSNLSEGMYKIQVFSDKKMAVLSFVKK